MDSTEYHQISESDERVWATFSHLGILAASFIPLGNIALPLVIWLINREKSEYIVEHAKEALNFQITMTIIMILTGLMCLILIGIVLLPIAVLLNLILCVVAAVKANRGEDYEYPFNFRIVK